MSSTDRALVSWDLMRDGGHGQIVAIAREHEETTKVQVDFEVTAAAPQAATAARGRDLRGGAVQKSLRVNGVQCTAADFVGSLNVVAFAAEDIQLVTGAPSVRRRYLADRYPRRHSTGDEM